MKKKVLLTSVMTIVLCMCLIAGSTYALFTSTSKLDVSVESGKVNMLANIESLKLWSVEADPNAAEKIVDENGHIYKYVDRTPEGFFTNGGDAEFKDAVLTMERVTPGDKVSFTLTGANTSNVSIQYRYIIECLGGYELMSGFNVYIDGVKYESLNSYTTAWAPLAAETDMADVAIEIELPVTAGNEYQDLKSDIRITVEAIQGNAVTVNPDLLITYVTRAASAEEAVAALADPDVDYVCLGSEFEGNLVVDGDIANKTIDALNHDIDMKFNGKVENVVVKNIVNTTVSGVKVDISSATGNITVEDCMFVSGNGTSNQGIKTGLGTDLVVKNCSFVLGEGKGYGIYSYNGAKNVEIIDCDFEGFTSWAYQVNGDQRGNLIIRDCTFTDCKGGIAKGGVYGGVGTTGTVGGNFVFTGNELVNCGPHTNNGIDWFGVKYEGVADIAGNTLDGAAWEPTSANGITDTVPNA